MGDIAKSTIKREIGAGEYLIVVNDMVTCLKLKFEGEVSSSYCIKQIDKSDLLK